jgi:tetratricopeptide (TPR) repeat protein
MTHIQPRRSFRRFDVVLIALAVAGGAAMDGCNRTKTTSSHSSAAAPAPARSEAEIRDLDIDFYKGRADRDPTGATDLAHLASLYLQRSRETGDPRDAVRAEQSARRSVHNRPTHNDQAEQVLASSLLAQHRFAEALGISRRLRDANPESAPLRAAVAEIEMELGQYDSARTGFAAVQGARTDLSVAPRLARWQEIEGHPDSALRLMRRALWIAVRQPSMPREQVAWFWLRTGDIEQRAGQLTAADSAYRSGLAVHPGDYRLLAARCRIAMAEQRWADAASYGEQAVASNLDPGTLGMLSDAYAAMGDTAKSQEYAKVLDVAVLAQPGAYHRAWSLFLLDHSRHVAVVDRKIRDELRTRRDVYGYDLLAWSLHTQGRDAEAQRAMTIALSQGTKDPLLSHHAAEIAKALGANGRQGQ